MTHSSHSRYALYFAPPAESELWRLAQRWLGRDCETGEALAQPALDGWSAAEVAAATESPRHYGFHATLKAPFRLAPGCTPAELRACVRALAGRQGSFAAPALEVSAIGTFIALTLSAPSKEMQALADAAVAELDALRAPLTEAEVARRLRGNLTPRQEALLRRWGYPYVFEEFRFHMTLTGSLADAQRRARLQTQLAALFRPVLAQPVPVREICLYGQASQHQPFRLAERFPFGAAADGGHLVLVVGPSGAGKDSLIDAARDALAGQPQFVFPRRIITRSSDPGSEEHLTLSEPEFARQRDAGAFFLHWSAHGLHYALPGSIAEDLAAGRTVVANVSRAVIDEARSKHPATTVVVVTAPPGVLAKRLEARGREDAATVERRLARAAAQPSGPRVVTVRNDGRLETAVERFLQVLTAAAGA